MVSGQALSRDRISADVEFQLPARLSTAADMAGHDFSSGREWST